MVARPSAWRMSLWLEPLISYREPGITVDEPGFDVLGVTLRQSEGLTVPRVSRGSLPTPFYMQRVVWGQSRLQARSPLEVFVAAYIVR